MAEYDGPKDAGEEIKLLFNTFDTNKDGSISKDELKRLLQHIDDELWSDEVVDKLLLGVDTSGDGELQFTEFWAWIAGHGDSAGVGDEMKAKLLEDAIAKDKEKFEAYQAAQEAKAAKAQDKAQRDATAEDKQRQRDAGERVGRKEFVDERVAIGLSKGTAMNQYNKADDDKDGEIDRQELGWLATEQAGTVNQVKGIFKQSHESNNSEDAIMQDIISTFNMWDSDGSGTVSAEELIRIIQVLNPKLGLKTAEAMIKQADTNGDGEIDVREFVSWISGVNPKKKKAKEIREAKMSMATHMARSAEAKEAGLTAELEELLHNSWQENATRKKIAVTCGTKNLNTNRLCVTCKNRHAWLCHGCGFVSYYDDCVNECAAVGTYGWTCLQGDCKKKCGCKKKPAIWQQKGFVQNLDALSKDVKRLLGKP